MFKNCIIHNYDMKTQTNKTTLQKTIIKDYEEDDCDEDEEQEEETETNNQITFDYTQKRTFYEAC